MSDGKVVPFRKRASARTSEPVQPPGLLAELSELWDRYHEAPDHQDPWNHALVESVAAIVIAANEAETGAEWSERRNG